MQSEKRNCRNCSKDFLIEPEDFVFYEKVRVPPPTWCPECRLIRRLLWRNERSLYKRKCDAPGHTEDIISFIAPEKPYTVYCQKYWWSDSWDALQYGRDYDLNRPFFDQFRELLQDVPAASFSSNFTTMVNSEYSNWAGDCKNCYLVTDADHIEDSAYCSSIVKSKDCFDCDQTAYSELCYDSFNIGKCSRCVGLVNCAACIDTFFSKNCSGLTNCFGCVNLRNKSYYIWNKPYTKEAYFAEIKKIFDGSRASYENAKEEAASFWRKFPEKYYLGSQNQDVTGDYIEHSKNVRNGYLVSDVEDSAYVALIHSPTTKDCFDYTDWGENAQRVYESIGCGLGIDSIRFSVLVFLESHDVEYSRWCRNVSNLFGCTGLVKKQYCILNKQYSKEEYERLIQKIRKHMVSTGEYGEFFPPKLSLFSYNESAAQDFFPTNKEAALKRGFTWREREKRSYTTGGDVLECIHRGECEHDCPGAFRIIKPEAEFYMKMGLPNPKLCPNCRRRERVQYRHPYGLYTRRCAKCNTEVMTSYAPENPMVIYCEQCYKTEVA